MAPLDDTNRLLITELQRDARLSLAELGRRVGLSSPAVAERLQRLEQSGTIRGYHADVDPRALGLRSARSSASARHRARSRTSPSGPATRPRWSSATG